MEVYEYDLMGSLTGFRNGERQASYTYNAEGMRKSKTVNGETTQFWWNGSNMILEAKADGTKNEYVYGVDGILSQNDAYYVKNGHGDVVNLIGRSGQDLIEESYHYDAFGNQKRASANANPFRYAGEYFDEETGNIYLRARYYDTNIGRFVSEDPIKDGLNWYTYCANNPVMFVDPFGLFDWDTRLSYSQEYNEDVEVLQNELVWLGYMEAPADGEWGYFGPKTEAAVNAYKNDRGLGNTGKDKGVVGLQTWTSLGLIYRTQKDIEAGVKIKTVDRKQYFDVTIPINNAFWNKGVEAQQHWNNLTWFMGKVNHGKDWDIKRADPWKKTVGTTYPGSATTEVYVFGKKFTPEQLGNMLYGYTGQALGLSTEMLITGSAYAAGGVDKNEVLDWYYIQLGIDWYNGSLF